MTEIVDIETAKLDFDRFVEALNINERKLIALKQDSASGKNPVDELIELIQYGLVVIDSDGKLVYKLQYPIKAAGTDNIVLSEVKCVGRRISVGEMEKNMVGKNDVEKSRKIIAYMCSINSALVSQMDDDFVVLSTISAFFLPR